ncbi:hypothetical protein ACVWXQ_005990 [Bradyrhizobium sp. S3.14.4]
MPAIRIANRSSRAISVQCASDEGEEGGCDQEAADDGNDDGDVDAGRERRQRAADGGGRRRRDHAVGFPLRKISLEALPIGFVEHRRETPRSLPVGGMLLVGPRR